jgi:hypothetical protein
MIQQQHGGQLDACAPPRPNESGDAAVPLVGRFWSGNQGGGVDIHVLRGNTSRRLDTMFFFEMDPGPNVAGSISPLPDTATLTFDPIFAFTAATHGHAVDPGTGAVTVAAALPGGAIAVPNFIIQANVTHSSPLAPNPLPPLLIRVHIHGAVTGVWLSPDPLTVRLGTSTTRFRVFAEFDDGTSGDISSHPGLTWASSDASVTLSADGHITATTVGVVATITVTLPPDLGGGSANATVEIVSDWATPVEAVLVPGSPGSARLAEVPNVLFLSDGFLGPELPVFETYVQKLVNQIGSATTSFPFNILRPNMNYWSMFVDSRERGSTPLNPYRFVNRTAGKLRMSALPVPEAPEPPTGITSVEHLIFQVGLPVPADRNVPFATKQADWTTLYGAAHINGLTQPIYDRWADLADYAFVFEQDSGLGLACGDRPQVQSFDDGRSLSWHPFRTSRSDLDLMLASAFSSDTGGTIGGVWASGGKDELLVFALTAGTRRSGAKSFPPNALIAASLREESEIKVQAVAGSALVQLAPYAVPTTPSPEVRTTVVHETAHVFHLGDEYGGRLNLPDPRLTNGFWNLQAEATVLDAGSAIDGTLVQWNWPRMSKVAVLLDVPVDLTGGAYLFTVGSGQGAAFSIGERVRLRRRPLFDFPVPSDRFEIQTMRTVAAVDEIEVQAASPINVNDFPAGTLMYLPTVHPTTGNELTLMWDDVRDHLTSSGTPLNRTALACVRDDASHQHVTNMPGGLPAGKPRYAAWLVALFDGGREFHCGVFHPSGACMMRRLRIAPGVAKYPGSPYRFCAVCRYIIVDHLDPLLHPAVDAEYATFYPV